jgi:hypothetical protein
VGKRKNTVKVERTEGGGRGRIGKRKSDGVW